MIRTIFVAVLLSVTATAFAPVFVTASHDAQAQPAADRKVQPGSGQCRDSVGRKCSAIRHPLEDRQPDRPIRLFGFRAPARTPKMAAAAA